MLQLIKAKIKLANNDILKNIVFNRLYRGLIRRLADSVIRPAFNLIRLNIAIRPDKKK